MLIFLCFCFLLSAVLTVPSLAQGSGNAQQSVACTFEDGKQMSVRYSPLEKGKARMPRGQVWMPGGKPMVLFTQSDLTVATSQIPVGAYNMFIIPNKKEWTLIVNKGVENTKYDSAQDLVRVPMELGELGTPVPLKVVLGHIGAKQCNMRVYYEKTGTWTEFKEK